MGVTAVFADVNPMKVAAVDPSAIVQQIQDHGAQSAFASPALWKPVARYCTEKGVKLPSLRRVMSAGAPIPVWLHEAFQQILEGAEVHTPYGATESLPVATVGSRAVLGETGALTREGRGTCVGVPAPGITIRVIRITDDPIPAWSDDLVLPDGEVGEICVSGEVVTREYRDEPEANKEAKIHEGDRIWHRIGDLGYFDDQGRLWFCGRKAHRVRAANKLLFSAALEGVLNEAPGVARTALVGVGQPGAQEPIIVVELESGADRAAVERDVLARAAANPVTEPIQRVLFHPAFPVDVRHNAKIKREILAEWAAGQLA
jgi:acyl-CoA synthetase (AMP-forming)/AMP-acid ligase II